MKSKHFEGKIFMNCFRFVTFAKNSPLKNNPLYGNITTFCAQLINEIKEDIRVHYQVSGDIVAKHLDKLDTDDYKQPFKGLEMKH